MKAIKAENLTKYYGKSRGIIDVSLSIDEGDFFGFIGPNGAGKSTFIRTALGLIAPTSGKIELLGKDVTKDRLEILKQVGYLPSEAKFWGGMRVSELLSMSEKLRDLDCSAERASSSTPRVRSTSSRSETERRSESSRRFSISRRSAFSMSRQAVLTP